MIENGEMKPCHDLIQIWKKQKRGSLKKLAKELDRSYSYIGKLKRKEGNASDTFIVHMAKYVLVEPAEIRTFLAAQCPSGLEYYESINPEMTGMIDKVRPHLGFSHIDCVLDIIQQRKLDAAWLREKYGHRTTEILDGLRRSKIIKVEHGVVSINNDHSEVSNESFVLLLTEYLIKTLSPGMPGSDFTCRIGFLNDEGYHLLKELLRNFKVSLANIFTSDRYTGEIKVGVAGMLSKI